MERQILHCDMNNFYASVECRDHPELREKPIAVCGRESERHGIVLAKNELAKKCGVATGEAIWQAKEKCPELILVEPHFEKYVAVSRQAFSIYREYTDLVEPFGLDECWLDVTASRRLFGEGFSIAGTLRERIRRDCGVTISCGVSFNKVLAKLGSDLKKPDATTLLPPESFAEAVFPLPVDMLLGVGRQTAKTLRFFGIDTIGKLSACDEKFLQMKFGKNGLWLKNAASGKDESPVLPCTAEPPMKSCSHGRTFPKDLKTPEEVWLAILSLTQEIGRKLRFHRKAASGVAITLKDQNFFCKEFQRKLPVPTDSTMAIARAAYSLFREEYPFRKPLRSVSVRAIGLFSTKDGLQLSLFQEKENLRAERIDRVMDSIRSKYGKKAIFQAALLQELPTDSDAEEDYSAFSFLHSLS